MPTPLEWVRMMYSLNTNSIRSVLKRRGARAISPADLPKYAMDQFGLRAINFSTGQLAGLTPKDLEKIRDSGDRVGCSCLLLSQNDPLPLGEIKGSKAIEAVERMTRVVKAASLMGCNAVSVAIQSKDTDDHFEQASESMKQVLEAADRAEINVLISPTKGLTEDADRLTDLVKGIGGFRIGTMPDFVHASKSGDPVGYLKKVTPYASVVNASTLGFILIDAEPAPEPVPEPTAESASEPAVDSAAEPASDPAASGAEGAEPAGELSGLEALAAELEEMILADDPTPVHEGYDLGQMVGAIAAVGFDGTVAIDYQGSEDETLGVMHSREAIEDALAALKD